MKTYLNFALALLLTGCGAKKVDMPSVTSNCPDDGKCTVEIKQNKKLEIKTDELGSLYYQILDNDQTSIVSYKYDRNVPADLADAGYTEEIIFEIPNQDCEITLSGKRLQETKMLFRRMCFCRGQTGNFKVQDGNLKLKKKGQYVQFSLDFKISEVPQIINSIEVK